MMQKYFWFCGFDAKENTGDGDYVIQMVNIFIAQGKDAEWIKTLDGINANDLPKCTEDTLKQKNKYLQFHSHPTRKNAVQKIINYIKENTDDKQPVFHLTIRPPETCYIITPQDLLDFQKQGIKVVVTCHEYTMNVSRQFYNLSSLAYFKNANQVIF